MKNPIAMKNPILKLLVGALVPLVLSTSALAQTSPIAIASANPTSGAWPLTVQFSSDGSSGSNLQYWWYFADGYTSAEPNPAHTYNCYGTFPVYLTVRDDAGGLSTSTITIKALQVLYSSNVILTPVVKYQKQKTTTSPISGQVSGTVVVRDTEGYSVAGATVQAIWTTPMGVMAQTVTTDGSGAAVFSVDVPRGGSGTYSLAVTSVSKTDYIYDATLGLLAASVQI